MRLGRCPVCHAHLHLDALVQDEAGRELLALCATLPDDLGRALVGYLALWRPARAQPRALPPPPMSEDQRAKVRAMLAGLAQKLRMPR